jgi:hypothetical protein
MNNFTIPTLRQICCKGGLVHVGNLGDALDRREQAPYVSWVIRVATIDVCFGQLFVRFSRRAVSVRSSQRSEIRNDPKANMSSTPEIASPTFPVVVRLALIPQTKAATSSTTKRTRQMASNVRTAFFGARQPLTTTTTARPTGTTKPAMEVQRLIFPSDLTTAPARPQPSLLQHAIEKLVQGFCRRVVGQAEFGVIVP